MKYAGYLIDLDGTMYRGNEPIDGAKEFIQHLQEKSIPHMFITNNSTSTQAAVIAKLQKFGIDAKEKQVLTSAIAAANYMKEQRAGNQVYMIGEAGLREALEKEGMLVTEEASDYVVVGLDRQLTYDKLARACRLIRNGATFISTNKDAAIPTEAGFMPGNGSITQAVAVSTGVEPFYIGKPEAIMVEQALDYLQLSKEDVLMVGDNYDTDITFGIAAQIDTLMVLTGVSKQEHLLGEVKQPTYIEENLSTWLARTSQLNH